MTPWAGRPQRVRLADADLAERIEKIWGGTPGAATARPGCTPRWPALVFGWGVNAWERIMADNGWQGAYLRRGWKTTTVRGVPPATPVPDLVDRDFTAARPEPAAGR